MGIFGAPGAETVVGSHATLASCVTTESDRVVCSGIAGAGGFLIFLLLIYLAIAVLFIIAYVKILSKAGYSGWWVLIGLVPLVGAVMFLVFAFSKWPVQRELEALRAQMNAGSGYGYGTPSRNPYQSAGWAGGGGFGGLQPQGPAPSAGPGFSSALPGCQPGLAQTPEGAVPDSRLPPFTSGRAGVPGGKTAGMAEDALSPTEEGLASKRLPPPGWYPTPDGRRRYWSGTGWTDHFA
ncbi:MAG: DUF805 domain-containing protein [Acidimicrobiales bacterium]